jgi:hypothetical protein
MKLGNLFEIAGKVTSEATIEAYMSELQQWESLRCSLQVVLQVDVGDLMLEFLFPERVEIPAAQMRMEDSCQCEYESPDSDSEVDEDIGSNESD